MTRPLASYLEPWIADGDPLPDTVTVNAADLLAAVGELRRMRELFDRYGAHHPSCSNKFNRECECGFNQERQRLGDEHRAAAALAPADGG
jgi:hypothetical protein